MKSSPEKPTQQLSKSEALKCIPFHNEVAQWEELENGDILIEYPLPLKPFLKSILQKFNKKPIPTPTKKLQLDEMGSRVWKLLDGKKNTKQLIKQFSVEYSISLQEAEISVTTFLRELGKRGLIGMDIPS